MKNWQVVVLVAVLVAAGTAGNVWYARRASTNVTRHVGEITSENARSLNQRLDAAEKSLSAAVDADGSNTVQAVNARVNELSALLAAQIQSASSNASAETAKRLEALERSLNARLDALGAPKVASSIPRDLNAGLVAYYPFDGNASDASGNGNNGTPVGAALTTDRFGNSNSAYQFDGDSSYIQMVTGLPDMESLSFSAWVFVPSLDLAAHGRKIFFEGDSASGHDCGVSIQATTCGFFTKDPVGEYISFPGSAVPTNSWFHFVVVADAVGGVKQVWINGSKIAEISWTTRANVGNHYRLQIGRLNDGYYNVDFFKGKLDDLRFYNRALSVQEIRKLYMQGEAH